jgi:hypothetical protein
MIKRLLIALLPCFGTSFSQTVRLPLSERGTDAEYVKTMMVSNVFEFRGDSVSNPLDFASAKKEDVAKWRKVKAPVMNNSYRKGFAWIFTAVKTDDFASNHTLILVENPGWTAFNSLIWTDRNHNYVLTDDGPPDTLKPGKTVLIAMDTRPNGFKIVLEHFPSSQFKQFAVMNDKAMYQLQGNRIFSGTENSFRIRRMNVLFGTWGSGSYSFSLCVKDVNCNGNYADDEIDEVMIADNGTSFQNLQSSTIKRGKAYVEWNSTAFYIDKIHPDGLFLDFRRDTAAKLKFTLNKGKKLPRFRYAEPTSKDKKRKRNIRRFKGEKLYVYIWHDQAPEYIRDSALLHALGRIKENGIKLLMLNYGASSQYLHRYSKHYETAINQGFSSNKINRKLKIRKIPTGILLDKKQKIIGVNYTPAQVAELL